MGYPIKYYGHVSVTTEDGKQAFKWNAGEQVTAVAYDNPIPGFGTRNTINLRLWAAKPSKEFDLEAFNTGDYVQARGWRRAAGGGAGDGGGQAARARGSASLFRGSAGPFPAPGCCLCRLPPRTH